MNVRSAFEVISRLAFEPTADRQALLTRIEAVAGIASALGYTHEADAALESAKAVEALDRAQLQLFDLLEAGQRDDGGDSQS